jgi:hypothetical protein
MSGNASFCVELAVENESDGGVDYDMEEDKIEH